jgi:hypothetical protein
MPKSDLLAVAFTDVNGNDKYNPGKDTLIASLVDTSNDHVVSVGDTIHWGTYPAIPDGSASGTGGIYTSLDDTVTRVLLADSTGVIVEASGGTDNIVGWFANSNLEEFLTQSPSAPNHIESHLVDSITILTTADSVFAIAGAGGPGAPNTTLSASAAQPGDQAFLDVHIL